MLYVCFTSQKLKEKKTENVKQLQKQIFAFVLNVTVDCDLVLVNDVDNSIRRSPRASQDVVRRIQCFHPQVQGAADPDKKYQNSI